MNKTFSDDFRGTIRGEVLADACRLTEGDRNQQHGDPVENLQLAANMLNATFGTNFSARDVGVIYTQLKIARIYAGDPNNRDTYVDSAAYLAMAYECQASNQVWSGPENRKFDFGIMRRENYAMGDDTPRRKGDPV